MKFLSALPTVASLKRKCQMESHLEIFFTASSKKQKDKRPGECPASLATTDSIIAGITAQNALKYLLGFGEVAFLLSYNAITNDFTTRMYARARLQPASRRATTHTPECRRLRRTYPDPRKLAAPGSLPE